MIVLDLIAQLVQCANLELPQSCIWIEAQLYKSRVSGAAEMSILDTCTWIHVTDVRPNLQSTKQLGARVLHDPAVAAIASDACARGADIDSAYAYT